MPPARLDRLCLNHRCLKPRCPFVPFPCTLLRTTTTTALGVSDLGNFGVLATRKVPDKSLVTPEGVFFHSKFSHDTEVAVSEGLRPRGVRDVRPSCPCVAPRSALGTHPPILDCVCGRSRATTPCCWSLGTRPQK